MCLQKGGWNIKCSKYEVFLQEAEFLGHRIMADGIRMVPGKVGGSCHLAHTHLPARAISISWVMQLL